MCACVLCTLSPHLSLSPTPPNPLLIISHPPFYTPLHPLHVCPPPPPPTHRGRQAAKVGLGRGGRGVAEARGAQHVQGDLVAGEGERERKGSR